MTKKTNIKNNKFIVLIIMVSILFLAMFASVIVMNVKGSGYSFSGDVQIPELSKGDVFEVPEAKFGNVDAMHTVIYPSGKALTTDKVNLTEHGKYVLRYSVSDGNTLYNKEFNFDVKAPAYYFTTNNQEVRSNAEYGYDDLSKKNGLQINLAEGETFIYNDVLNINNATKDNPLVKFTYSPKQQRSDAQYYICRFTDIYDATNYVEVEIKVASGVDSFWCGARARAAGQVWKAWDYSGSAPILRINSPFNTPMCAFAKDTFKDAAYDVSNILSNQFAGIYINPDTKELHVGSFHFTINMDFWPMCIDLDDISYQEVIWPGFETGECYFSIVGQSYVSSSADLVLFHAKDKDLTATEIIDRDGPIIDVDFGSEEENNLPKGAVGYSYPVFDAVASDVNSNGYVKVEKHAYYGYVRSSGIYSTVGRGYNQEINIVDGRFATEKIGKYAIVYRAYDFSGNCTEKVVEIQVDQNPVVINNVETVGTVTTVVEQGNKVSLASVKENGGGAGKLLTYYHVTKNDEEIPVKGNDIMGYYLVPEETGIYTIKAGYQDLIGNTNYYEYNLLVLKQSKPAFKNDAELPQQFVQTVKYLLPELYATNTQKSEVLATVTIKDGTGERTYTYGSDVTFTPDINGKAIITYTAGANSISYSIPVISMKNELNEIDLNKYFEITGNGAKELQTAGMFISANGNGGIKMVQTQLARDLTFTVKPVNMPKDFNRFNVILTDSVDASISVKLTIDATNGPVDLLVNGNLAHNDIYASVINDKIFTIKYDLLTNSFLVDNNYSCGIKKTVQGEDFNGFPSSRVIVSFEVEDCVNASSGIILTKINSQQINAGIKRDTVRPMIYLPQEYGNYIRKEGSVIDIIPAIAGDVLSPYTKVTFSVTFNGKAYVDENGKEFTNIDATKSGYKIVLSERGEYLITYSAVDWANVRVNLPIRLEVLDEKPPVITISGTIPTTVSAGKIKLPIITATDNASEEKNIVIYATVIDPYGNMQYVVDRSFTVKYKGVYELIITAMDQEGNIAMQRHQITAK